MACFLPEATTCDGICVDCLAKTAEPVNREPVEKLLEEFVDGEGLGDLDYVPPEAILTLHV